MLDECQRNGWVDVIIILKMRMIGSEGRDRAGQTKGRTSDKNYFDTSTSRKPPEPRTPTLACCRSLINNSNKNKYLSPVRALAYKSNILAFHLVGPVMRDGMESKVYLVNTCDFSSLNLLLKDRRSQAR